MLPDEDTALGISWAISAVLSKLLSVFVLKSRCSKTPGADVVGGEDCESGDLGIS